MDLQFCDNECIFIAHHYYKNRQYYKTEQLNEHLGLLEQSYLKNFVYCCVLKT